MSNLSSNLGAIIADYDVALQTLKEVLQHIDDSKPEARLRIVLLNNTIVALTATSEEILRALFEEYLSILEGNFEDYRKLRIELQKSNLECAIRDLKKLKSAEDLKAATDMVSDLAVCMNGHLGYRLLKEKLVYNQANFRSAQVTEISKNLGVPNLWRRVCDAEEIEEYTGEEKLETRESRLIAKWNELFDERDLVVHRTSQANGWAPERIQESITLSRLVVNRISECLLKDAEQLVETKNKSEILDR